MPPPSTPRALADVARDLARRVDALTFRAPVAFVYNPLVYAREPHERYLARYGAGRKDVLFLGMNPGPFGMAQTGVPFGDVGMVRDVLGVVGEVGRPPREHGKRPVEGFSCRRREVSGSRLWGWVAARRGGVEGFFRKAFVANYCPLAFLAPSGANLTPDRLPADERTPLFAACDEALRATASRLGVRFVVGVGAFARDRARAALEGTGVVIASIPHPSPASPAANRGWAPLAEAALARDGVPLA